MVTAIKQKRELQKINEDFVRDELLFFFQREKKVQEQLEKKFNPKSADFRQVVKEVRSKLRRVYSLFRIDEKEKNRQQLVKLLLKEKEVNPELLKKILETNASTKERIPFYATLYQKLFKITGEPKLILDLGCGINPFSVYFTGLKELEYLAYDLNEEEIGFLNRFFRFLTKTWPGFKGKAEVLNLRQFSKLKKIKNADVCFLFKFTDVLDRGKGHKVSEEVITAIPAKNIIVSFPTKTMSGKEMSFPERKWIELMCKRLGYGLQAVKFNNEIFYVLRKRNI